MNLIYITVFHQESYINLLKLLITSISIKANVNQETTDILIVTCNLFQQQIQKELKSFDLRLHYYILDLHSLFEAGCARLNIFKYHNINKYDKILYLDTDILLNSDVNVLFNLDLSSEKIYALQEGNIGHVHWGEQFFDFTKYDRSVTAFTSGILLFRNSDSMKTLFDAIESHIRDYIYIQHNDIPICLDQPFIVYNAISQNKYDNQLLKFYVENCPSVVSSEKVVYHFPGGPGSYDSKIHKMTDFWGKMNDIIAVSPSNVYDTEKMKYLLYSAKINNFTIETIGINKSFIFLSKIIWLKEYLESLPMNHNPIICFTDAYDVFYLNCLYNIKQLFLYQRANIVWSVEKWYSHQLQIDKPFFDNLLNLTNSPYKYINTGAFIGYKNSLLNLLNDIDSSIKDQSFLDELGREGWYLSSGAVDQTIVSHHLAKNWNKYDIKLDYLCSIFYTSSGDWDDIDRYINSDFVNVTTSKKPSIVHVPWKLKYEHILIKLFNNIYKPLMMNTLDNKKYSWDDHSISFLENGEMDAFGKGTYTQQDIYTFQANFGGRTHTLVFNYDYMEFISTRHDDKEIKKGKLL